MLGLLRKRATIQPVAVGNSRFVGSESPRIPQIPSDKDRAVKTAREVLKYERAGITITPSETINLAREYLKSLRIPESSS